MQLQLRSNSARCAVRGHNVILKRQREEYGNAGSNETQTELDTGPPPPRSNPPEQRNTSSLARYSVQFHLPEVIYTVYADNNGALLYSLRFRIYP